MRHCALAVALLIGGIACSRVSAAETEIHSTKCSAAMEGDGYVYVAGQSGNRSDGTVAGDFPAQASQAFDNVKSVVTAAGLTMDNVVYLQIYLENVETYSQLAPVFKRYFPAAPPAAAILGVAKLPLPGIQVNAIAVRDLAGRKAVVPSGYKWDEPFSPGILTHDRLFVSAMQGRDPKTLEVAADPGAQTDLALDGLSAVAEAAGLSMKNFVFVNPYLTTKIPGRVMNERYAKRFEFGNTPGRATIGVTSLPRGAQIEYTGIAVRDLSQRRAVRPKNMPPSPTASPCVFAGDTLYCSAKSGFIPGPHGGVFVGTTTAQLRQTMRNQLDNLEEAGMDFRQLVTTTVYLDSLSDSDAFNKVYAEYFQGALPAQTTVQQLPSANRSPDAGEHYPDLEQMSLIGVKGSKTAVDTLCK